MSDEDGRGYVGNSIYIHVTFTAEDLTFRTFRSTFTLRKCVGSWLLPRPTEGTVSCFVGGSAAPVENGRTWLWVPGTGVMQGSPLRCGMISGDAWPWTLWEVVRLQITGFKFARFDGNCGLSVSLAFVPGKNRYKGFLD